MATFLSEVKIIDLNRSRLDTSEMDLLESSLKKLEKDLSSLKLPKKPKDEAKTADYKKALETHEKKSKKLEMEILKEGDKIATLEKKEKKDRAKGVYKFAKGGKVYTNQPMADSLGGLDAGYKFKWNRDDERAIRDWKIKFGFELVTVKDPYLAEGGDVDAEGRFTFDDAVLMKITLRKYAEKQMRAQAKSDRAMAGRLKEFESTLAEKGVEASDEFIGDWKKKLGIDNL